MNPKKTGPVAIQMVQPVVHGPEHIFCPAEQRSPFGGDYHIIRRNVMCFQSLCQGSFRTAPAISLGGVEPVNASFQGNFSDFIGFNGGNGFPERTGLLFPPENCQVPGPTGVILISVFPSGTVIHTLTSTERAEMFVRS